MTRYLLVWRRDPSDYLKLRTHFTHTELFCFRSKLRITLMILTVYHTIPKVQIAGLRLQMLCEMHWNLIWLAVVCTLLSCLQVNILFSRHHFQQNVEGVQLLLKLVPRPLTACPLTSLFWPLLYWLTQLSAISRAPQQTRRQCMTQWLRTVAYTRQQSQIHDCNYAVAEVIPGRWN